MLELHGFDELEEHLNELAEKASEFSGTHDVSFDELFPQSFMEKYTNFSSIDELLESGGFHVETNEYFESIPDDDLDRLIASTTTFDTWEEMLEEASSQYALEKLGL